MAALMRVSAVTDAVVLLGWHGKARQGAGEMMQTDCSCDEHNADTRRILRYTSIKYLQRGIQRR